MTDEFTSDWQIVTIADIFNVQQGKQLSSKENPDGKVKRPFLRTSNIFWEGVDISKLDEMYFDEKEAKKLELKKDDILVCEGGDIGRTAIWSGEKEGCLYQNHLHRLRPIKENYSSLFFWYWMNYAINIQNLYVHNANRTTIPNLSSSRLKSFQIPLPSISEQRKIAHVLHTIQTSKEKSEAVISSLKELKKSMMQHLFTYGAVRISEIVKIKLKQTETGEMPEDWKETPLSALTEKTKQIDPKRIVGEMRYVDVSSIDRDYLRIMGHLTIDSKNAPSRARKKIEFQDVLVATVRPTLKRIAIVEKDYNDEICSTAFCVLKAKQSEIEPRYIFYCVQRECFIDALGKVQAGASYPAVTDSNVREQLIPVPPKTVQAAISSTLGHIDSKIQSEQSKKEALDELFKSMLQNLMTGKVRVNSLEFEGLT